MTVRTVASDTPAAADSSATVNCPSRDDIARTVSFLIMDPRGLLAASPPLECDAGNLPIHHSIVN
jgi:hypothetical protein